MLHVAPKQGSVLELRSVIMSNLKIGKNNTEVNKKNRVTKIST
jgi:hypothetical protein